MVEWREGGSVLSLTSPPFLHFLPPLVMYLSEEKDLLMETKREKKRGSECRSGVSMFNFFHSFYIFIFSFSIYIFLSSLYLSSPFILSLVFPYSVVQVFFLFTLRVCSCLLSVLPYCIFIITI